MTIKNETLGVELLILGGSRESKGGKKIVQDSLENLHESGYS